MKDISKRDAVTCKRKRKIQLYADLQAERSRQRRGLGICLALWYLSTSVADVTLSRADFIQMKKFKKPEDFSIRESDDTDGCVCLENGIIFFHCLETGICPSLKIIAVFKGHLRKEKSPVRKEKNAKRTKSIKIATQL